MGTASSSQPSGSLPLDGSGARSAKRRLACPVREAQVDNTAGALHVKRRHQGLARSPVASCDLCMYVLTTTAEGATRLARLPLEPISGVCDLRPLFRRLIRGAFPGGDAALPDYLTSPYYYKYAPAEDFVSLPGDAIYTHFRLVACINGCEVTLAERQLGAAPDPDRNLLVTVAEFESAPVEVGGGRQVIATLVAYPAICVRREFLDTELFQLHVPAAARRQAARSEPATSASSIGGAGGSASSEGGLSGSLSS